MKKLFLLLWCFLIPTLIYSQENCACCSSNHKNFDFWVGDWEVFNAEGVKIGENLVEKLEDNCIVSENWTGVNGNSGKSFNYYQPIDSTWNQLWISNTGNILKLKGHAEIDKMILLSDLQQNEKGSFFNRITWTKNNDGTVTQLWEILNSDQQAVKTAFKGIYKRKDN